jgi:hypothetical protein
MESSVIWPRMEHLNRRHLLVLESASGVFEGRT